MSEAAPQKSAGRSVVAVIAGLLTVIALDLGIDAVMHAAGAYPAAGQAMTDQQCLLAISYRLIDGIVGGYVAARLAPNGALRHAVILGCIGVLLSLAGAIATWNMNLGPRWYSLALVVIALPCASAGGSLRARQLGSRTASGFGIWLREWTRQRTDKLTLPRGRPSRRTELRLLGGEIASGPGTLHRLVTDLDVRFMISYTSVVFRIDVPEQTALGCL